MTEARGVPGTSGGAPWRGALDVVRGLAWNPIVEKEVLARMRSWRAPLFISLFVFLLSLVGWVGVSLASAATQFGGTAVTPGLGLGIFAGLMVTELILVVLIAPALTAGAISGEKERQTLDLLLCTRVRPSAIVAGKLVSSLLFILLLVLISVPLVTFVFLFGGIEVDQVVVVTLLVMVSALSVGAIGIFCSCFIRNAIGSTAAAFLLTVVFLAGPMLLPLFLTAVTTPRSFLVNRGTPVYQLGEPFYTLAVTLAPPNTINGGNVVSRGTVSPSLSHAAGPTTVCNSLPGGGQECHSVVNGQTFSSGPVGAAQDASIPAGNVIMAGDMVTEGPIKGWHAWQVFVVLNVLLSALLLTLSTILLGGNRVGRAGRGLRLERHAVLPPLPGAGDEGDGSPPAGPP
ncbi:MAG: ABC transporter permease [Candidatus Dormibacteria bacterium]